MEALLVLLVLLVAVGAVLERAHRRTAHLPRAPFGADREAATDADLRRLLAELRALDSVPRVGEPGRVRGERATPPAGVCDGSREGRGRPVTC